MKYLKPFNEKFHVNSDVKHLTSIIYNKIYQLIPSLIIKKEIVINNLLQDNYSRIKFKDDKITVKLGNKHGGIININISDDDVIENLDIEFIISLSKMELSQKKLINNSVREDINHEFQHIIGIYYNIDNNNLKKKFELLKFHIRDINRLSKIYKRKIDRVFYFHNNPDLFLEENIDREIDYRGE